MVNMFDYCQEETIAGVANLVFQTDWENSFKRMDRLAETTSKDDFLNPWAFSKFPDERLAKKGYQYSLGSFGSFESSDNFEARLLYYHERGRSPERTAIQAQDQQRFRLRISEIQADPGLSNSSKLGNFGPQTLAACAEVTLKFVECARGIEDIAQIMDVRTFREKQFSLLPVFGEVLGNENLHAGIILAAKRIAKKVESGHAPAGDWYSDLVQAFKDAGLPSSDAMESAWKAIGIISTSGSNLMTRLSMLGATEAYPEVSLSLMAMAGALPLLDVRSENSGHLYSYPPQIQTSCNQAKPYHFWMSAYLARELVKRGYSPESAASAVYTAEKGYMVFSDSGDRRPERSMMVPEFDSFNNVMRMDLAYAGAGATFGSESVLSLSPELRNVDEAVRELVRNEGPSPLFSHEEAKDNIDHSPFTTYWNWRRIFAPNLALESFRN